MSCDVSAIVPALEAARTELFSSLPTADGGLAWCQSYSDLGDQAIEQVYRRVIAGFQDPPRVSIAATGGYGRRELAPYSDFDLAVIPLDEGHERLDDLIRALYRALHEVLGGALHAEVGYAYRLVNDAPGLDGKSRSSMLDARLIAGSKAPLKSFMDLFVQTFPTGDFLLDKIRERERRMAETHDTPLVVEPQLKEGAGGIRSHQAANWIRKVIAKGELPPSKAYDAILRARNLLHFVSGKRVEVLSRPRQAEIADAAGLELASWLASTAGHMEVLHEEYLTAVRLVPRSQFRIALGVQCEQGIVKINRHLDLGAAAMGAALATGLGLELEQEDFEGERTLDGPEALRAVSLGERTLRSLDRCGLLARLIPELERCRTLMPEDAAHTYTVYEHTLRAIRNLEGFGPGTFLGELRAGLSDVGPLYLALLLHDAGKGLDERPHSESGAELAERVCRRWNLGSAISQSVVWLVREHLTLALFVRMRDIQNPRTAAELAEIVGSRERLDMLTLMTAADIQAVSEAAWTPAQENLLRELWSRTAETLDAQHPPEQDPALYRRRLHRALASSEQSRERIEAFLQSLPAHYLVSTPPDLVRLHMSFAEKAAEGTPTIEVAHQPAIGSTELTVCCLDAPGLLSRLLGVLYAWDLSVQAIRVSTSRSERPVALDTFTVSFGSQPIPPATCQHTTADLMRVIKGEVDFAEVLVKHGKDPNRKQGQFSCSYIEGNPGILEVRAPRGRGMAFRMSKQIAEQGWDVTAARIGQWAGQGAAAFYILDADHRPIPAEAVRKAFGSAAKS